MTRSPSHRRGRVRMPIIVVACLTIMAVGIYVWTTRSGDQQGTDETVLVQRVERGDFEAFVTEPGDVASSSNVEVRCRVKSRGAAGTAIVKICEEGVNVAKGDFLIQFDDSVLQQELLAQKIVVTNDKALLVQANNDLANAKRTLREFDKGTYQLEIEKLDSEVFVAQEERQRAEVSLAHGEKLFARGFITRLQLKAEQFAFEKAKKDLAAAESKRKVYIEFTREKMIGEYEAEIKKQEAAVEAAEFTLELSQKKLTEIEEQIGFCLVTAPSAGQVVYAADRDRGDAAQVIEEGTVVRENKVVIRLPDLKKMQVEVKINEAYVNRIKPEQPATIELDADPDAVLVGKVKEVAAYPFPVRWHGAPIEYGAVITLIDPPATIRPGLRAKVKIMFESEPSVLQVPLAAVIEHGQQHFCLVRDADHWRPQLVEIGKNNDSRIIVRHGLDEGEQVSLTPFRHIKRSELPDVSSVNLVTKDDNPESSNASIGGPLSSVQPAAASTP